MYIKCFEEFKKDGEVNGKLKHKVFSVFKKIKIKYTEEGNLETFHALRTADIGKDKYGTTVLTVHGGYNGPGEWINYLNALTDLFKELKKHDVDAWVIDIVNDCPDDVFDAKIGVAFFKKEEDKEEKE